MYKSTKDGVKITKPWILTNEDRFELISIINDSLSTSISQKIEGNWKQGYPLEHGYRKFNPNIK